jgi:hypothetical protein
MFFLIFLPIKVKVVSVVIFNLVYPPVLCRCAHKVREDDFAFGPNIADYVRVVTSKLGKLWILTSWPFYEHVLVFAV